MGTFGIILILLGAYLGIGVLNLWISDRCLRKFNSRFKHLHNTHQFMILSGAFTPLFQIGWLIFNIGTFFTIKKRLLKPWETIGILLIISLPSFGQEYNSPNDEYDHMLTSYEVSIDPIKETIGLVHSYDRLILSGEIGGPKTDYEYIKLFKLGVGYKVYTNYYYNYSVNAVIVGTHVYDQSPNVLFLNPNRLHKLSLEVGGTKCVNKFVSSIYMDLLNYDVKVCFGFKF